MPSCELCGKDAKSLTKVKIEGAKLKTCENCSELGEKVESPKKKKTRKKKRSKSRTKRRNNQVLVQNYGSRVKEARESRQLSIKELSDSLNEKSSLLKKVEREDLKPEKTLAEKLEKELDIELYTNPEAYDVEQDSGDNRKATLGDVAEIKD